MFLIKNGPFKGTSFDESEAFFLPGQYEGDAGRAGIAMPILTQHFLERFDPSQGWAIQIDAEVMQLDMFPLPREGVDSSAAAPCIRFKGALTSPDGKVVGTSSTVWTMAGPTEWERGETNARQRLYEAMGLQTRFDIPEGVTLARQPASYGGTTKVVQLIPRKPSEPAVAYAPAEDEASAPTAAPEQTSVAADDNPLDDQAAVTTQTAQAEEVAGDTGSSTDAITSTETAPATDEEPSKGTKAKRERLKDEDPAPPVLLEQCRRVAAMRGKTVPDSLKTKGEANAFLRQLAG